MEIILEILERADHLIGRRLDTLEGMDLIVCENNRIVTVVNVDDREFADILTDTLKVVSCTLSESRRDTECCDHTSDCRMDSRIEHCIPKHQSHKHIEELRTALEEVSYHHHGYAYS